MTKIKLSRSFVGEGEKKALSRVIDNAYLGMGEDVQRFENRLKEYLSVKNVVCVSTGTAALHLALMAVGLRPGDEVLVQSLTYVASFQAISATGAQPVPCEIVPATCTIDLKDAGLKLSKKTRAIMPVHYAGRAGDLDAIYAFANEHGLRVIEDAAHAFGTVHKGRKIGSMGDVACFSFDGIKNITCGEGGAIVTDDEAVVRYVQNARLLGVEKDTEKRYRGERSWEFDVMHQGYRYHMSNLFAAIGLVQLERFEKEFKPLRQRSAEEYHNGLKDLAGLRLFPDDYNEIVPHIFPVRVLNNKRDALRKHLTENDIECGVHYYPNHLLTYYGARKNELPVTERIYSELLTLPLHCGLTDADRTRVLSCVRSFF